MDHEVVIERLHDLHEGTLDERVRLDVESHLAGCEECRGLAATYRVLRDGLAGDAPRFHEHPRSEEIVHLAIDGHRLSENGRTAIGAHIKRCRSCREEFETVQRVERSIAKQRPRRARVPVFSWFDWRQAAVPLAISATILVAALAYPAFLGLFRLPEIAAAASSVTADNERLRSVLSNLESAARDGAIQLAQIKEWSGATTLQLITGVRRDASSSGTITIERPFVVLGIDMGVPANVRDDDTLRVELKAEGNPSGVQIELTARRAREQIKRTGVVTVALSAASLMPGRHELRVSVADEPNRAPLVAVTLDLVDPAP